MGSNTKPFRELPVGLARGRLDAFPIAVTIADPRLEDCPLIYVNAAFERLTGFAADEVIGRNCRFLQGDDVSQPNGRHVSDCLRERREVVAALRNYRKDGTPFTNEVLITPLTDETGELLYFLGFQSASQDTQDALQESRELGERLAELQHRVKNHLAMILAMIRLEADTATDAASFARVLSQRVEAISLLYAEFDSSTGPVGDGGPVALGAYLSRVASAVHGIDGHANVRLNTEIARVETDIDTAARIGLILSEVLTNALQHAFAEGEGGELRVSLATETAGGGRARLTIADDGQGIGASGWPNGAGLGGRIVRQLVDRLDGELIVERGLSRDARPGTVVTLIFDPAAD